MTFFPEKKLNIISLYSGIKCHIRLNFICFNSLNYLLFWKELLFTYLVPKIVLGSGTIAGKKEVTNPPHGVSVLMYKEKINIVK